MRFESIVQLLIKCPKVPQSPLGHLIRSWTHFSAESLLISRIILPESPVKTGASAGTGAPDFDEGWRFPTEESLPGIWPELRPNSPAGGSSVLTLQFGRIYRRQGQEG